MLTKEFIKEVRSISSCSGHEQMMRSYVLDFAAARGGRELDADWFSDVSFCLSFDSPERNRSSRSCAGVALYPDSVFQRLIKPIALKHGVTNFNHEPYTDVVQIRRKAGVPCYNVGNGGYRAHCPDEYLVVEDAQESFAFGLELLESVRDARIGLDA